MRTGKDYLQVKWQGRQKDGAGPATLSLPAFAEKIQQHQEEIDEIEIKR